MTIYKEDLQYIKQLEMEIGEELPELEPQQIGREPGSGYAKDETGYVVGLNIHKVKLNEIPELVAVFKHLKMLSLYENNLKDTALLECLTGLTTLNIIYNRIRDISFLKNLSNLTKLNLQGNRIEDISSIQLLSDLRELDLGDNKVTDISFLQNLSNLRELNLSRNQLADISFLQGFSNLSILNLCENPRITDYSSIKGLFNLSKLYLEDNGIKDISFLQGLLNLSELSLGDNKIEDISFLQRLSGLQVLNLSFNEINDISHLQYLPNLMNLDLRNNRITHLPQTLITGYKNIDMDSGWSEGYGIHLNGNPLEEPPPEIIRQGYAAIQTYFNSLKGSKHHLNEVRVLLVGEGGAGKTSLLKGIIGVPFDENEPQTHGINIQYWRIKQENTQIKVNLWDFGGQEILHATHQFFLSRRSLYILVLDGRKDEKTEYWLKHIRTFGGNSPILIVLNKIDHNHSFDINRRFLMEKYSNIKSVHRISCATKEGMNMFSNALAQELASVEIRQTTWPENWFNVKKHLESMKANYISYKKYKKICIKEKIEEELKQDTLLDFLNDLGVVLHFKDIQLEDTQVLEPRWVTEGVYCIINSNLLAKSKGILNLKNLPEILKQNSKKGFDYPKSTRHYIVELMKKFELCYELPPGKILIPVLMDVEESLYRFENQGALSFIIRYDFLPPTVMPRFIVRMHKDICNQWQWRTGVVLENDGFKARAVVKADLEDKNISIKVSGEQKRDYFAVILHTFREINSSYEEIKAIEKVPMPTEPNIEISYQHLLRLEKKGTEYYLPDGSEHEYNVKELLGDVNQSTFTQLLAQEHRRYLALEKIADKQKRGYALEVFINDLLQRFDLKPRGPFKNIGEQFDGSFQLGNLTFLMEIKWKSSPTKLQDLLAFQEKISGKSRGTRGLFVSINGYTSPALEAIKIGRSISIVGMDGDDLELILKGSVSFPEALRLKMRWASEDNLFFVPLKMILSR